jgi:hypothetical protein
VDGPIEYDLNSPSHDLNLSRKHKAHNICLAQDTPLSSCEPLRRRRKPLLALADLPCLAARRRSSGSSSSADSLDADTSPGSYLADFR